MKIAYTFLFACIMAVSTTRTVAGEKLRKGSRKGKDSPRSKDSRKSKDAQKGKDSMAGGPGQACPIPPPHSPNRFYDNPDCNLSREEMDMLDVESAAFRLIIGQSFRSRKCRGYWIISSFSVSVFSPPPPPLVISHFLSFFRSQCSVV
jgi:hypothetical protein